MSERERVMKKEIERISFGYEISKRYESLQDVVALVHFSLNVR